MILGQGIKNISGGLQADQGHEGPDMPGQVIKALEVLSTKREKRPPKKHGNIPV
jgi:hypothetical protein